MGVLKLVFVTASLNLVVFLDALPTLGATLPGEKAAWVQVESEHFIVFSDAAAAEAIRVATDLEHLCDVLSITTSGLKVHSDLPTLVYLFKNDRSFNPYKLGADGRPQNYVGCFVQGADANFICIDASAKPSAERVAYHEYLHRFVADNYPNAPLWLDEGLAEFFSTFFVKGNSAKIGLPIEAHLQYLNATFLMPLPYLFSVTRESKDYHEGSRLGVFYAQSWALAHFLSVGESSDLGRMGRLLKLFEQRIEPEAALGKAVGFTVGDLENRMRKYVGKGSFHYRDITLSSEVESKQVFSRSMAHAEVLFRLGDLLAHRSADQHEAAELHLARALELEPSESGPYTSLGLMLDIRKKPAEAATYYARALAADSTDWRAHYLAAISLLSQLSSREAERAGIASPPSELLNARAHLRDTIAYRPEISFAWWLLGRSYLTDPTSLWEGMEALTTAAERMPSKPEVLLDLIFLTARTGSTDAARDLLDTRLRLIGSEELISQAENVIQTAAMQGEVRKFNTAIEHMNAGQLDSALTILIGLTDSTPDSAFNTRVRREIAQVEAHLEREVAIKRYNEAVDLMKKRRYPEAASMFRYILEFYSDEDIRSASENALRELGKHGK